MAWNSQIYENIRVRCVAFEREGTWVNGFCIARACPIHSVLDKQENRFYRYFKLLERWLKPEELFGFIDVLLDKKTLHFGEETVVLENDGLPPGSEQLWSFEFMAGDNKYDPYPGDVYCISRSTRLRANDALLASKLPFYPDISAAIIDWCGVESFSSSHASAGSVMLYLPECRAYVDELTRSQDQLIVSINSADVLPKDLRLKGSWKIPEGIVPFDLKVEGPRITIDIPPQPEDFEAYLIGADETLFDYHKEAQMWRFGRGRALRPSADDGDKASTSEEAVVRQAIGAGEGMEVEFKPYIKPGDNKRDELTETTIAFANTVGGNILIGVNNHCAIVGIEKEVQRSGREGGGKNLNEELEKYLGQIKQHIAAIVCPSPALDFKLVKIDGHIILLVTVSEGHKKPYHDVRNNSIYVRRGSNNMFPNPVYELPQLFRETGEDESIFQ